MKKILFILIIFSLPFGHILRYSLSPAVSIYPQDIFSACLFILLLTKSPQKTFAQAKLLYPLSLFFLTLILSLLFALFKFTFAQVFNGSLYFLRFLSYSSIYFYLASLPPKQRFVPVGTRKYFFLHLLLLSGLVFASFGLIQYLFVPDLRALKSLGWDDHYFRLTSTFLDPDYTGIILLLTFFLSVALKLPLASKLFALSLSLLTLLLTYSRGSYLAFALSLLLFFLKQKKALLASLFVALFLGVLFLLPRPGGSGVNLARFYSIEYRLQSWRQGLAIFSTSPFVGVGFNLLRPAYQRHGYFSQDLATSHSAAGVQNSYLFVLATTGVLGLISFIYLLLSIYKHKVSQPISSYQPAIFSSILIHALFTNTWFYPWLLIWLFTFLGVTEKD